MMVRTAKDEVVILGRKDFPGEHISRNHAKFILTNEHQWNVSNMGRNGVYVNGVCIGDTTPHTLTIGDTIQFGQPDTFVYRFKAKRGKGEREREKGEREGAKKSKLADERLGSLTSERADLERRLRESEVEKERLEREKEEICQSLQSQQEALQHRYEQEKEQLEQKYTDGTNVLKQKETLAVNLKQQVAELKNRLDEDRNQLEDKLLQEEKQRNDILKEKECVESRLQEENARRTHLEKQLQNTQTLKDKLQQQVEAIESASRLREQEQQQAEQELRTKLDGVESEMKDRIEEEVRKSTKLQEEREKEMSGLMGEKEKLLLQLQQLQQQHDQQRDKLQDDLHLVEAQKMSLEQELATTSTNTYNAKLEVVESVSDVLENELQCPICSEMFITAIMLGCSHTFCRYCIDQWKKNKNNCPNCRENISSETRSLVVDNFIDKIVPTLSDELKKRRNDIVHQRKVEMEAAALAQAQAQAQAQARRRGRGGRAARARGRGRNVVPPPPVPAPTPAAAFTNLSNLTNPSSNQPNPQSDLPNLINPPLNPPPNPNPIPNTQDEVMIISSEDENSEDDDENSEDRYNDSSSEVSGDESVYYGGYGRCYVCHRRGHWANGCPSGGDW
ncbi:hypothetical protein Pmani_012196 [Petrolisthes manimaculis]|uniref:E3 ubiquitin-protein ligase CHFR n=1 Tax=Petrolisthes manimaculis TaxID=1843537 RepID=A0AAE1UDH5_9EUCA|nr:hypothetical protein Pmani_012196 [Petrolisthes manimaculis]